LIFFNQLPEILPFTVNTEIALKLLEAFEQAKARHKEECINLLNTHNDIDDTSEDHYNKTFGGNDEQ
jgi:hypothetical protein